MITYYITVILISFFAAFFSGLLGIGGGIIIFPSFLYLMPMLGFKGMTVNEITGVAATQALMGSFFAYISHRKLGFINTNLVKKVIIYGILGSLSGAIISRFVSEKVLLVTYVVLLTIAASLIIKPQTEEDANLSSECKLDNPFPLKVSVAATTAIAGSLGFGGAVTFIPLLNHFCKASIKTAISSTTLIVLITTAVAFLGKATVGLIPYHLIFAIIFGAFFGAKLGAFVNKKLPPIVLRIILLLVVLTIGTRIFLTILEY